MVTVPSGVAGTVTIRVSHLKICYLGLAGLLGPCYAG
jgi:hypothetical protein